MAYFKQFEIRWNDLDANRHVANASFSAFCNDARMSFLHEQGFTQKEFAHFRIGPAVLNEAFYYLKEVLPREKIMIDIELEGLSEDGMFNRWAHCIFKENGELAVYSTLVFAWIDLEKRKLTKAPPPLLEAVQTLPRSDRFAIITKADMRPSFIPRRRL